jgi:hypothetical protein
MRMSVKTGRTLVVGCMLLASAGACWESASGEPPLISIIRPTFNSTLGDNTVIVKVQLGARAIPDTFRAELDGNDITYMFASLGNCQTGENKPGGNCFRAHVGVTVPKAEKYTVEGPVFSTAYARRSR